MRTALLAVPCVLALVAGCSEGRPPGSSRSDPAPFQTVSAREDGDALVAGRDYAGAVVRYRAALREDPADVAAHYGLGVALSHLNQHEETVQQFTWLLEHARADRQEVALARQWLREAGRLDTPSSPATSAATTIAPAPAGDSATAERGPVAFGALKGRIEWPGVERVEPPVTVELRMKGEGANEASSFRFRLPAGRAYTLPKLPAGPYTVVGRVGDVVVWSTRVVVPANGEGTLDLTPANSQATPAIPIASGTSG